jgi:hypothetical protein
MLSQFLQRIAYLCALWAFVWASVSLAIDMSTTWSALAFSIPSVIALAFGGTYLFSKQNLLISIMCIGLITLDIFRIYGTHAMIAEGFKVVSIQQQKEEEIIKLKKKSLNDYDNVKVNLANEIDRLNQLRIMLVENNLKGCEDKNCRWERKNNAEKIKAEIDNAQSQIDLGKEKNKAVSELISSMEGTNKSDDKKYHPYYQNTKSLINSIGFEVSAQNIQNYETLLESIFLVFVMFFTSPSIDPDYKGSKIAGFFSKGLRSLRGNRYTSKSSGGVTAQSSSQSIVAERTAPVIAERAEIQESERSTPVISERNAIISHPPTASNRVHLDADSRVQTDAPIERSESVAQSQHPEALEPEHGNPVTQADVLMQNEPIEPVTQPDALAEAERSETVRADNVVTFPDRRQTQQLENNSTGSSRVNLAPGSRVQTDAAKEKTDAAKSKGGGNGRSEDSLMDYTDLKNAVMYSNYLLKDDGSIGQNRVEAFMGVGRPKAKRLISRLIEDKVIDSNRVPLIIAKDNVRVA